MNSLEISIIAVRAYISSFITFTLLCSIYLAHILSWIKVT